MSREMERKLNYPFDERTRFSVRITKILDPKSADTPEVTWVRGLTTLKFAQMAYIEAREAAGLDASKFLAGEIWDEAGQHVARVSFGGRVWPPMAFGEGIEPVGEAPEWPAIAEGDNAARDPESQTVLREMIFDITEQRELVPSFKPTSPADGKYPTTAKEWARAYGTLYSYESAIDAAGYETEADMRSPAANRTVVMVEIDDQGRINGTWLGNDFTFTPAQVFAHFGVDRWTQITSAPTPDEDFVWMTGTPESVLQDAYTGGPDNAFEILVLNMEDGEILVGKDRQGVIRILQEKVGDGLVDVPGGIEGLKARAEAQNNQSDAGFKP